METAIILGAIVQIVTLIVFFVMAANLSNLKKIAKTQLEQAVFSAPDYLKMVEEINNVEMPEHTDTDRGASEFFWVGFAEGEKKRIIYRKLGKYSCFLGPKEVYFRTKEDAIKGLYLHKTGKI